MHFRPQIIYIALTFVAFSIVLFSVVATSLALTWNPDWSFHQISKVDLSGYRQVLSVYLGVLYFFAATLSHFAARSEPLTFCQASCFHLSTILFLVIGAVYVFGIWHPLADTVLAIRDPVAMLQYLLENHMHPVWLAALLVPVFMVLLAALVTLGKLLLRLPATVSLGLLSATAILAAAASVDDGAAYQLLTVAGSASSHAMQGVHVANPVAIATVEVIGASLFCAWMTRYFELTGRELRTGIIRGQFYLECVFVR